MFVLTATGNDLKITGNDLMTRGSVNVNRVEFHFSSDWEDLDKKVIFSTLIDGKTKSYEMPVEDNTSYFMPWELFVSKDNTIFAGVYGIKDNEVVLPTERKRIGVVKDSVMDETAEPVVPWDPDDVPVPPTEGGTTDHRKLTHRDSVDQHPMKSISGLENEITRPITNTELEAILV